MKFISVILFSFATGFVALAQEIIWVRIMMYHTGGRPEVFAYVLGSFLAGVAIGSWWTRNLCNKKIGTSIISMMLLFRVLFFILPLD